VKELNRRFHGCVPRRLLFVANKEENMAGTKSGGGSKRGFAAMDPAKQREIASKGGRASHGGGRRSASSTASR
jgi:general stress protein YciG